MKFSDCIKLSFLNLKSYKKTTAIICVGMLIALCLIISAFTYNSSITESMADTINDKYSNMYIDYIGELPIYEDKKEIEKIKNINGFTDIKNISYIDFDYMFDEEYIIPRDAYSIDNSTLIVDGKSYQGLNDYSYDFYNYPEIFDSKENKSVNFNVESIYIKDGFSQFSQAEKNEYYSKHSDGFLIGSEMKNNKDIIMSEYILSKYGFSLEYAKKLIGKKITLTFTANGKSEEIVKDYTLCGILRTDFYDVSEFRTEFHIIVPMADKFINKDNCNTKIFFDSFKSTLEAYNKLSENTDKWVNTSNNVIIYSEIEKQQTLYNKIIILILSLIIFAVIIFMLSSIQYYFNKRLKFITLECAIGMKNNKIFSVFVTEFMLCGTISFIVSIPLSYMLIKGLIKFLQGYIGGTIKISPDNFIVGLIFGFIFVLVVSFIFAGIQIFKIKKYSIVSVISE